MKYYQFQILTKGMCIIMRKVISSINFRDIFNYKLHLTVLVIFIISNICGVIKFSLFNSITIIILPLVFSLFLSLFTYSSKLIKWIGKRESQSATVIFMVVLCPLIAKLAIISGQNISLLYNTGPLIILEELGDIMCIFIALPIALILGFRKEAIGMTSSICREPQMAVIIDKYGINSDEYKGFMIVYIMGIILGTVFMSFIVNILVVILPLHPYAYALGCGIGSTSMNVAGVTALTVLYPDMSNQLIAFSGIANIISVVFSIYIYIFISLPLTEKLYSILSRFF